LIENDEYYQPKSLNKNMNGEQQQYINEFVEDAQEHLDIIEQGILNLTSHQQPELVYEILRSIHSIELNSEILGINIVTTTAKDLKFVFEILRDYPIEFDLKLESLFLQCFDILSICVNQLIEPFGIDPKHEEKILPQIEATFKSLNSYLRNITNECVRFSEIEEIFPLENAVKIAASEYNKQVEINISGRGTIISKFLLKKLPILLTHLINNSITHGIETPETRVNQGKSPVGKITIRAYQQANQTLVSFADDGAGIDVERVTKKALDKGLINHSQLPNLSKKDIYELIFHPGFSTKDTKDLRAGLGYGMDVIRSEINKLGGKITIDSIPQQGTNFTIYF
jgi:chemotaxis protein histidine kinase CheA